MNPVALIFYATLGPALIGAVTGLPTLPLYAGAAVLMVVAFVFGLASRLSVSAPSIPLAELLDDASNRALETDDPKWWAQVARLEAEIARRERSES
jgi:hypothetical protein